MQTEQLDQDIVTHIMAGEIRFEKVDDQTITIIPSWDKTNIPSEVPPHGNNIEK